MGNVLRRIGKFIQVMITFLLALLLVCNLYLIGMERIIGVENPTVFGYSVAVIASGSMEPALSVDDLILNHIQSSYTMGDVITFRSGSSLTTHRIVGIEEDGYITQGDANNTVDGNRVAPDAIVGKVVAHIPGVGAAIWFLKSPLGMMLLVFVGFLLIVFPAFMSKEAVGRREVESNEK